jgi:nitrate/TMAO reductase-like tetraheme cytochrome c subunit
MLNKMKIINVFSIAFLIVVSTELIGAEHLDILKPDELEESYLKGSREEKSQQCRKEVALLFGGECTTCHNNDVTDFTEKGNRARDDMKVAIAIGVKCEYCHADKEHFAGRFEIAVNMFRLSEMMNVECDFCHKGRHILTSRGETAKISMLSENWVETGNEKCLKCHVEKRQFKLNARGENVLNTLMCQ